jgi:hypothetical protein
VDSRGVQVLHERLHEPTELPSGIIVAGRVARLSTLLVQGLLPDDLAVAVVRLMGQAADTVEPTPEVASELARLSEQLAAAWVTWILDEDTGTWEPLDLTVEDFRRLDRDDQATIEALSQRQTTPRKVTIESRLRRGVITPTEAAAALQAEVGSAVTDWAPFRDGTGGPPASPDSRSVRRAALRARGRGRTRVSPGARPGPRPEAAP